MDDKPYRTCPVCGQVFMTTPGSDSIYCSTDCKRRDTNSWITGGLYLDRCREWYYNHEIEEEE